MSCAPSCASPSSSPKLLTPATMGCASVSASSSGLLQKVQLSESMVCAPSCAFPSFCLKYTCHQQMRCPSCAASTSSPKQTGFTQMVCASPCAFSKHCHLPKNSMQAFECPGGCPVFSKKQIMSSKCLRFWNHQKHVTMDAMAVGGVENLQLKLCMAGRGKFVMNITWPVAVLQSCSKRKHVVHKTPRNGWHDCETVKIRKRYAMSCLAPKLPSHPRML